MFLLMKHLNVAYDSFYKIPVRIRTWLLDRIVKYHTPASDDPMKNMDVPITQMRK